ncbi:unnamed protein product, partial [Ixodes persulcatus]
MFDEVLAGKKVIFMDTFTFVYYLGRFYKSMARGEFYMAKETVVNPAMCMWINRNLDNHLASVIHRWKHLLMERSRQMSSVGVGSQAQSISSASPLQFHDVAALMQILLMGYGVALSAFF